MFTVCAQIEKCSQVLSVFIRCWSVATAIRPKKKHVCVMNCRLHLTAWWWSVLVWFWTMSSEQLSEQLRLVMDRQGALENALMQERQARAEAEQRLSIALGEVGGRADAAVATAAAGASPTPVSVSSSCMMGCIDTRNRTSWTVRTRAGGIGSSSRRRISKLRFRTFVCCWWKLRRRVMTCETLSWMLLSKLSVFDSILDEEPCTGQSASSWRRRGSGSMAWSSRAMGAVVQESFHEYVAGYLER